MRASHTDVRPLTLALSRLRLVAGSLKGRGKSRGPTTPSHSYKWSRMERMHDEVAAIAVIAYDWQEECRCTDPMIFQRGAAANSTM